MAKKESEEPKVVETEVKIKQSLSIKEFAIMKGIINTYYLAFELYCRTQKKLIPKTFAEWDKIFSEFKNLS